MTTPEPILIRCEGSRCQTNPDDTCKMCGVAVAADEDCVTYEHQRMDILAMLDRGDFDPPRIKAAPIRSYCAPCKGTGQQRPPGGRHPATCPACHGQGVR